MESYEILWKTALPEIENTVSAISYDTYISNLVPVDVVGTKLILITDNELFANVANSVHLGQKIRTALLKSNSEITDFEVLVAKSREEYLSRLPEPEEIPIKNVGTPINPNFTFDSFVVGSSNEFIYAAAKAVAENPGESYNPLFIYGGTGLGKTHILMAIANHIKKKNPALSVLYATCEQFTNQFIESISKGKNSDVDFRKKYRNIDVLLLDDVQFLAKKQGTQTEFFHTFHSNMLEFCVPTITDG